MIDVQCTHCYSAAACVESAGNRMLSFKPQLFFFFWGGKRGGLLDVTFEHGKDGAECGR